MASFALVILPAWAVFGWSKSWKQSLIASVVIGVMSYLIAFVVALSEDQPFAPVQVTILLMLAVLSRLSHLVIHRIN